MGLDQVLLPGTVYRQLRACSELVNEAQLACPLITIWKFFRCAFRYLQVYKLGATGVLAEFAVKKFNSHCSVMAKDLEVAQAEWEEKQAKLTHCGA